MSSAPKAPGGAKKQAPSGQKGRPEKKAATGGPAVTPQALGILFAIILIIGLVVYFSQTKKLTEERQEIENKITSQQGLITTYKKKGEKLEEAIELNNALREKLNMLDYLFLQDQSSILPFFENTLIPLIDSAGTLRMGKIEPLEPYQFKINMAMEPFNTIPSVGGIEDPVQQFTIEYEGEKGGTPVEEPITTKPSAFLTPYSFKLTEFAGTYQDCIKFVKKLQTDRNAKLITVHCVKNDDSNNAGLYRTSTTWDMVLTVYFMNPEVNASGDEPPGLPGSQKC